jgi:hypothetical protein
VLHAARLPQRSALHLRATVAMRVASFINIGGLIATWVAMSFLLQV